MKIDSALTEFTERYSREAIMSIEDISKDIGLSYNKKNYINGINGFNIKESFEKFEEILTGYTNYKTENVHNPEATDHDYILKHTKAYISEKLFPEAMILYKDLPLFVETYITGIKSTLNTIENLRMKMYESEVDDASVLSIYEFVDDFTTTLQESFHKTMDKILWASGYNSRVKLAKPTGPKVLKPVFL